MKKFNLLTYMVALFMLLTVCSGCSSNQTKDNTTDDVAVKDTNKTVEDVALDTAEDTTEKEDVPDGYITSNDMLTEELGSFIDMSMYKDANVIEEEKYTIYSYDLKYENKTDYDLDYKVKLSDGTEFTMPVSLSKLMDAGWSLVGSAGDSTVIPGYMGNAKIENKDGLYIRLFSYNDTDKDITFKEGKVCSVILKQYNDVTYVKEENAAGFTVCDNLTQNSSIEDVLKRLGAPYHISYQINHTPDGTYENSTVTLEYIQKNEIGARIDFTFSGDDNCIYQVDYSVS